jgi:protein-disulfide isomerase
VPLFKKSWFFLRVLVCYQVVLLSLDGCNRTNAMRLALVCFIAVLMVGLATTGWHFFAVTPAPPSDPVVATVGARSISLRDVEQRVPLPLYLLDTQRHQLLQGAVQDLIDETLLEGEAKRKGVSLSQLLEEASESESIARLADLPAPIKRMTSKGQTPSLDAQQRARLRQALIVSLRRQVDVRVTLPRVEPPVLDVTMTGDRQLGSERAPITIVEFSDFECPYCRQSVAVLRALRQVYGDRIRLVYRDYLGPNHAHALRAAEASRCAGEQGKFWEYHDLLFDRQVPGNSWDFNGLAKELHLQGHQFETCLQSGRFREQIGKDLQDGLKLGITSTPTFLINGRPLVGAQPLSSFQTLIDSLLAHPLS